MTAKKETTPDHPDQAIDTPVPGTSVKKKVWETMAAEYEGDPEEVDGQADDDEEGDSDG